MLLGFGVTAGLFNFALGPIGITYAAIAFAAAFLRDIGWYRRTVSNWPFLKDVLDWSKIERLISSDIEKSTVTDS